MAKKRQACAYNTFASSLVGSVAPQVHTHVLLRMGLAAAAEEDQEDLDSLVFYRSKSLCTFLLLSFSRTQDEIYSLLRS